MNVCGRRRTRSVPAGSRSVSNATLSEGSEEEEEKEEEQEEEEEEQYGALNLGVFAVAVFFPRLGHTVHRSCASFAWHPSAAHRFFYALLTFFY